MFKNELLIDEIKDLENKISYVFKTVFLSFIKNKMKITSYLFFIKLTNCLPADCYSVQEKNVKVRVQEQEQVRVQERVQEQEQFKIKEQEQERVQEQVQSVKEQGVNSKGSVTSKATFYFRVGENVQGCPDVQSFNDGNRYGPCSEGGEKGVKYTENSKYWVAIANAGSRCRDTITVNYGGNSLQLKVMDECPACAIDNHVDMSLEALIELTGSKENACAINTVLPMITWY